MPKATAKGAQLDQTFTKPARQPYRRDRARRIASHVLLVMSVVGLVSAVSRPLRGMLTDLLEIVPFVVPQTSAITLVFVSFAMMLTARGLRRGHRLAWVFALVFLSLSSVLHIAKGVDIPEASLSSAAFAWLATQRRAFPVLPSRTATTRAITVSVGGGALALALATGLAMRADHRHRRDLDDTVGALLGEIGGRNSFPVDLGGRYAAPVLIAIGLCVLGSALWLLLSPRTPVLLTGPAHHGERERARRLVEAHGGGTLDYFALRDDKQWFFSGHSMVAHTVRNGVCLVSPDPIGPAQEREEIWAEFMLYIQRFGCSVSVLGAASGWLPIYEASGLRSIYMGDEAVVDCPAFTLETAPMKKLRQAYRRVQRSGYSTTFHDPTLLAETVREELAELSAQSRRGETERGFSMTLSRLFDPQDTGLLLAVVRDPTGRAQAFAQFVPARDIEGWSLDVMHRSAAPALPNGIMDFLIIETIHHIAGEGGQGLGLNFAMLRRLVAEEPTGTLARASRGVVSRAAKRTQIESLWKFNAKYQPSWVPRYVIVGTVDDLAIQGWIMAHAEGLTEIPVIGRFMGQSNP